jgi:hypothetical protein
MAICNALNAGISKSCDNNAGGLVKIYIADFDNVTGYTESNSEITAITMASSTKFYEFEFNRGTSNYAETVNINLQNGTTFFTQTVSLVLSRREKTKAEAIKKLTDGQKQLFIIVKDSNGLYWAFGKDEGMVVTAIEGGSGTAKADANNYTITFTGEEADNAPEVDDAIIAAIIA